MAEAFPRGIAGRKRGEYGLAGQILPCRVLKKWWYEDGL